MPSINTRVDAATAKYALLGGSLPHTLSPQIHNTLFDARMLNAIYLPLPVSEDLLPSALALLRQGFAGFNVTIPYKEAVIPFLDELAQSASDCGAVNTVVVSPRGEMIGHNTDGEGLSKALNEALMPGAGVEALLLGGGGTARVAALTLLRGRCHVTLALRQPAKGEALKAELCKQVKGADRLLRVVSLDSLEAGEEEYELLINATPVGMYPHGDASPVGEGVLERCQSVFDAIYNPPETRLLAMARRLGCKTANGFGMLYWQAVEAQRLWLDRVPPAKTLRELRRDLEALI